MQIARGTQNLDFKIFNYVEAPGAATRLDSEKNANTVLLLGGANAAQYFGANRIREHRPNVRSSEGLGVGVGT